MNPWLLSAVLNAAGMLYQGYYNSRRRTYSNYSRPGRYPRYSRYSSRRRRQYYNGGY